MIEVQVFPDAESLGDALATEIMAGIESAGRDGRRYLLGCPGGRSGRTTYVALARRTSGADLRHVVIVMMDEYLAPAPGGGWQHVPADAHFSCRRFATDEIAGTLNAAAAHGIPDESVWLPDPTDPTAYEARIAEAGGVDLFIVASGASDGHVAFVPPGSPADSGVGIVCMVRSTRTDNLATFPDFRSIEEVPTHGVSVGLGTICRQSRHVRLVIHGSGKRVAAARVLASTGFDPAWPATFIHGCRDASIWLDTAAHPDGLEALRPASARDTRSQAENG